MRINAPRYITEHEPTPRRVGNSTLIAALGAAFLVALVVYAMATAPAAQSSRVGAVIDATGSRAGDALSLSWLHLAPRQQA